jgi:hypothetical protein
VAELTKRWRDLLERRTSTPPPEPVTPLTPEEPVRVGVRLPDQLYEACSDSLTESLRAQLSTLAAEFSPDRVLEVTVQPADGSSTAASVTIDRRPVAYLRTEQLRPEHAAEQLLDSAMSRILRRLPLLAGPSVRARSTAAYLMTLGCRVPAGTAPDAFDADDAEQLINSRTGEEIVLEVAAPTMRRVEGADRAMVEFREAEFRKQGVVYPDVHVVLTDDRPGSVQLRLNDVTLPVRRLSADAGWNDVVRYIGAELASRRYWFVRLRDVARLMDEELLYAYPDLIAVATANYSRPQVTACMRELVRSSKRMRNLARILWLLIDAGGSPAGSDILRLSESPLLPKTRHRPSAESDPIVQAVRVRKLAAEEAWRLGNYRLPKHAVRLAPGIEEELVARDPAEDPEALVRAEWAAVRAVATMPAAERVITRTVEALGPVRRVLQAVENAPHVRASHELPPDADIDALPVLTDPEAAG